MDRFWTIFVINAYGLVCLAVGIFIGLILSNMARKKSEK